MSYHPSLIKASTRERLIAAQAPTPPSFEIELQAVCEAYRGADNYVAYYGTRMDQESKRIVASSRDRFYAQLRPLLARLVVEAGMR